MTAWLTYFRRAFSYTLPEDRIAGSAGYQPLWENLLLLWPAIRKHWPMWLVSAALLLITSLLSYPQPLIMRYLIDTVLAEKRLLILPWVLGIWAAISVLSIVTAALRQLYVTRFDQEMTISIQKDLLEKTMRLPKSFFDATQSGYLLERVTNDVRGVRWFFSGTVVQLLNQGLQLAGGGVFLFYLEWRIALPIVLTLPLCWYVTVYFSRRSYIMGHQQREQNARVTTRFQESLSSMTHIKTFASEDRAIGAIMDELRRSMTLALERLALGTVNANVINLMPGLARFAVLGFGSYWIIKGEWTIGSLLAFQAYLGYVYGPAMFLANTNIQLQDARASLERVAALYRVVPEDNVGIGKRVGKLEGRVEFDHVSFAYAREPVLEEISFAVEPGECVAIVGHSGAGKTTLISLILRLYVPTSGQILFDGVPASAYEVRSLRERIGYVAQSTHMLSGTIMENLRYGNPDASDEDVMHAARIAGIHNFITALPGGYASETGENGVTLSEGQKQRLSIARALVKDPDILILDEPTSALDPHTAAAIFDTLPAMVQGKTVFIVAHRLAAVSNANRIMVLDGSRLAGVGTHEVLRESCPAYQTLFSEMGESDVRYSS